MTLQKALFVTERRGVLNVDVKEIQKPGPGELLVKVHTAALNPVDWKIWKNDFWSLVQEYPVVIGVECAGAVEETGEGVTGFNKGDRVIHQGYCSKDKGTFQQYVIAPASIISKIPEHISFDEAATVPLGLSTAAIGLYAKRTEDGLFGGAGLHPPWEEGGRNRYAGKPILILGGACSVGQYAIQLAKLSGFSPIVTTASHKHTAYLKGLGAHHVIDRNSSSADIATAVKATLNSFFETVYDAVSMTETQQLGYDLLAPGGTLVVVLEPGLVQDRGSGKNVVLTFADVRHEKQKDTGLSLCRSITSLLDSGDIRPNRVEVLRDGLAGIQDGLNRLERQEIGGVKLVVHPQDTN